MGVSVKFGAYKPPVQEEEIDFDLRLELLKEEKEFLPLGIPSFGGEPTNDKIKFKLIVSGTGIQSWELNVKKNNTVLYTCYSATKELKEVVVTSKSSKSSADISPSPENQELQRFWPPGSYIIEWDGFDKNEIYDSMVFTEGELIAEIKGEAEGKNKTAKTKPFSFKYEEVEWANVRIDKNSRVIDIKIIVDLKDGGEEGLNEGSKVSDQAIQYYDKQPINDRTKSFDDLIDSVLNGIEKYWSRNKGNIGKGVIINNELYEVNVSADWSNADFFEHEKSWLKGPGIIYCTNKSAGRSRNWELSRKLYYNTGYLYESDWKDLQKNNLIYENKGWYFRNDEKADKDFQETAAHEIGHEIILAFGGHSYSKGHKGSSTILTQSPNPNMPYPESGEIDLMKYSSDPFIPKDYYTRVIAAEKDVLGLIWLSKISFK